ncbi:MAG: hypothetical protein Kow0058_01360 [Roseovarius sp.]
MLPDAGPADWRILREQEDGSALYHAATLDLELHRAEASAYLHGLAANIPSVYVILRETGVPQPPLDVVLITASPYEAQDYADSSEDIVERIAMPAALRAWVREFAEAHRKDEDFRKRRRDRVNIDGSQDGIGDPRIRQPSDVYLSPALLRRERLQ